MKQLLQRAASLIVAGLLVGGLTTTCAGAASTEQLCDDACSHWANCNDGGTGYIWSYDDCYAECRSDGDWDRGYVNCVLDGYYCWDLEAC